MPHEFFLDVALTLGFKLPKFGQYGVGMVGMEKKHLNKIFIIFQRLHGNKEYSGTGIGLAICKKIIENHQGKIDVTSVINEGSVFSVYLPLLL